MLGAKLSLLHNMLGAKFFNKLKLKNRLFARKNDCTGVLLALHANNLLYGRIFHNSRIFLQNIKISDRVRFKTA